MGATLGTYVFVRMGVELWARPHYEAARTVSFPFFGSGKHPGAGDWVLSTRTVDRAGHLLASHPALDFGVLNSRCPGLPAPGKELIGPGNASIQSCVRRLGIHLQSTYQPGSRYWTFQGIESAIFVALACGLLVFSVWWVRRRMA